MRRQALRWLVAAGLLLAATEARAQETGPPMTFEGTVGWSAFVDDDAIEHTVFGGALRIGVTPRISLGPEVMYMVGPGSDRDTFVLGTLWFDVITPGPGRPVVPYLVAGGGYMHHSNEFAGRSFSAGEGAFSGGGGVRVRVNDRVYAGVDARLGWELHLRLAGHVGIRLR